MNTAGIIIVGLGPGEPGLLTRQAWELLHSISEVYVRTQSHPAVASFPAGLLVHSFDSYFDGEEHDQVVSERIAAKILQLGRNVQGVVYAVPGHPLVDETATTEIVRRARSEGLPVQIVAGISITDAVFNALQMAPLPRLSRVDALILGSLHVPNFPPDSPALITEVNSRSMALSVRQALLSVYPENHPVVLVHGAGTASENVESLQLKNLGQSETTSFHTALFIPSLDSATSLEGFQETIAHLRAPDGCPWDREQTHLSLRPYLIEEAYEVLAALDAGDMDALREELGDLLLQIVLHAQIANEAGEFRMADVIQAVQSKIIRRHPHVFGDVTVDGVGTVLQNWEKLKAAERKKKGKEHASIFDGVPVALPALSQAEQLQSRAARVGFEWPELHQVYEKVQEELHEVRQAESDAERMWEIGDIFFAMVNLARTLKVEPESALREASLRFRTRFNYIEDRARTTGRAISNFSIDEMLAFWKEAKEKVD